MANKKPAGKGKAREKPQKRSQNKRSFWGVFFILLVIIIVIALIVWQWQAIVAWSNNTALSILRVLGLGLILIVAAIAFLAAAVWRCGASWLIFRANRWLGTIALIVAIWGILAYFRGTGTLNEPTFGGYAGLEIIDQRSIIGVLRVLGLIVVGVVLIAPRQSFRLIARFFKWLWKQMSIKVATPRAQKLKPKPRPVPEVSRYDELVPVRQMDKKAEPLAEETAEADKEIEEKVPSLLSPSESQLELKQVAQEVWKKYGESPDLVTIDGWKLPAIDILDITAEAELSQADNVQRAGLIEEALASYGVDAKVDQINVGPTVTQFGIEPGWDRKMKDVREKDKDGNIQVRREEVSKTRVKVDRITSLANDLALALAAPSIRIEAPVPGKSLVGIEVPNTILSMVSLRGVIETSAFQKLKAKSPLSLALGKGAGGEAVVGDLTKMPHLLVAGSTGSGKTVCLNTVICCLLIHNTPYDTRFIMIDPKRVELTPFNSIPHLAAPVVVDTDKALGTLRWLTGEMDRRYQVMASARVRNIDAYNKTKQGKEKMPYLVLVIDELADLMMTAGDEVEHILCRLAQLARATGIHLIVATQRPSVDVVTGLIKANFPTRVSFAVTSQVDSRTILDIGGAEKLLGRGDMLYMPTEAAKPKRLQGCFVSDAEVERLVYFWGTQQQDAAIDLKIEPLVKPTTFDKRQAPPEDPLLGQARQLAEEHKRISTSFLQRRLQIGYPRAARIMEQLQEEMEEDKYDDEVLGEEEEE